MNKFYYNLLNWYAIHFPFPKRGLKYLVQFLKKHQLLEKEYLKKNKYGIFFKLNLLDHIQKTIFWYGCYEPNELAFFITTLHRDSVFIDIGANVGNYSLVAAKYLTGKGHVHSFEVSSTIIRHLNNNILLNQFSNIRVNHMAIAEFTGQTTVFLAGNDNLGMTGLRQPENYSNNTETITSISLDEYIEQNKIKKLDIVKMDIEGYELMALHGMKKTLLKFSPLLLVEIKQENLSMYQLTTDDIYDFMESLHYLPYKIISHKELRRIQSKKTEADLVVFSPPSYEFGRDIVVS